MKLISAHQPAYIPWLGYFHKLMVADQFVVMDDVQFEKNSFINRNKILNNGQELMLTIPVKTKDYKEKKVAEIEIDNVAWKGKHLKSLEHAYKKQPYFNECYALLERALSVDSSLLVDYTNGFLLAVLEYLDINKPVAFATQLSLTARKLDYVIELTQKCEGDAFLFGALGKQYADEAVLNAAGVKPFFQSYQHPQYKQDGEEFKPYMSIIDCIMRNGKETAGIIMTNNASREAFEK